ncbi:MAG TPA: sigma factor-like helix-turn-helix DNA-binding protein [Candidatus Saccharimonadales bacterium]|nr:sigma factor-like helix-turn-helix DNA-binding protein [Candidatus Saccharimonadales bacterium]
MTVTTIDRIERLQLLDTYRAVLTERQKQALHLHLEEDWSVTELAQALGTSRAAAHDLLRRGLERMEGLESRLGLLGRIRDRESELAKLRERVRRAELKLRASASGSESS